MPKPELASEADIHRIVKMYEVIIEHTLGPVVRRAVAEALAEHEPKQDPALLTATQLCEQLQISRATLHRLNPPRIMVVDSPRYHLETVLEWLRAREIKR
jgi:hypothetical protein